MKTKSIQLKRILILQHNYKQITYIVKPQPPIKYAKTNSKTIKTPSNKHTKDPTQHNKKIIRPRYKIRLSIYIHGNKNIDTQYHSTNKMERNKTHKYHTSIHTRNIKLPIAIPITHQTINNKSQKLNPHKNLKHHARFYLKTQLYSHTKHQITPKHKMASAYRPRHKIHIKHHLIRKPRVTTNYITKNYTHTYLLPKQIKNTSLTLHLPYPTTRPHNINFTLNTKRIHNVNTT